MQRTLYRRLLRTLIPLLSVCVAVIAGGSIFVLQAEIQRTYSDRLSSSLHGVGAEIEGQQLSLLDDAKTWARDRELKGALAGRDFDAVLAALDSQRHGALSQCSGEPRSHRCLQQTQVDRAETCDQQQCTQARWGERHTQA